MGKLMTLKPKGKTQALTLSKAQINEYNRKAKQAEQELIDETTDITIILFLAYLMEEPEFDYDGDKLAEIYDKVNEWSERIGDHTLKIQAVINILRTRTNIKIKWRGEEDAE